MRRCRTAFSLIEVLVVIGIIAILVALLLPAVQRVREAGNRVRCMNNLKQLGLALQTHHDARGYLPPGMISAQSNVEDAEATGYTLLLPYIEQVSLSNLYHFDVPWYQPANYKAVGTPVPLFFCPSNSRTTPVLNLVPIAASWGVSLPPVAGATDYAFCKGANATLTSDWNQIPESVRGVFNIRPPGPNGLALPAILDGTSTTMAMGDASGGGSIYVRDLNNPTQPVYDPIVGGQVPIDQAWGAAGVEETSHPWYGSVFAVTAQYGLAPDPRDEPMNRSPATPTVYSKQDGDNASGTDYVSGFRSLHTGGCNFLFCDGHVQFLMQGILPDVYRALSTYAGGEPLAEADY